MREYKDGKPHNVPYDAKTGNNLSVADSGTWSTFDVALEAYQRLQCPVGTLRRLMAKRKFPYLKLGGRVRVDASELDSFLEKSRCVTATEAAQRKEGV